MKKAQTADKTFDQKVILFMSQQNSIMVPQNIYDAFEHGTKLN